MTPGAFVKNQALWSADNTEILLPMYYTPDGQGLTLVHFSA
jgi:hypothetical protein